MKETTKVDKVKLLREMDYLIREIERRNLPYLERLREFDNKAATERRTRDGRDFSQ